MAFRRGRSELRSHHFPTVLLTGAVAVDAHVHVGAGEHLTSVVSDVVPLAGALRRCRSAYAGGGERVGVLLKLGDPDRWPAFAAAITSGKRYSTRSTPSRFQSQPPRPLGRRCLRPFGQKRTTSNRKTPSA